jgi:CRP-like cAMP-binding protein
MAITEQIMQYKIFEGLSPNELEKFMAVSQEVSFKSGEVILEESSFGADSDFFIILQGNVKVEIQASRSFTGEKANKRLAVLKDGEVFGEMGLLGSKRRSARVSAYSDLVVLKVNQQKLFEILTDTPNIGYLFMRNLAAILSDRIMDMNFMWRNEI